MTDEPPLEPGEKLIGRFVIDVSRKERPFHFAVSDQAVFWPAVKFASFGDPFYFRRIPLGRVQEVAAQRVSPYLLEIAGGIAFVIGLLGLFWILVGKSHGRHRFSPAPLGLLITGIALFLAARGRSVLRVTTSDGTFRWKPPLVVDRASRVEVSTTLTRILRACERAGLRVLDSRESQIQ